MQRGLPIRRSLHVRMPVEQPKNTAANTLRIFGSLTVLSIGVGATLATVLGFFGSLWWAFDTLSGDRVQFFVLLVVVAAGFRIGFGIATGALFLAAAVANAVIVAPLFLGAADPAAADAGVLRIASVPVEEAGQEEAMAWIVESEVDIAFLLDTDDTWSSASPPAGSGYRTAGQVLVGRQTGITVVSKAGIEITIEDARGSGAHPLIRATTHIGDRDMVIYSVFLPAPGSSAEANQRNDVLTEFADRVARETVPVSVIGGLGASSWSHAFGILTSDTDLVDSSPGNGYQASSPSGFWIGFRVPHHHLLHTSALTTLDRHIDTELGQGMRILQATLAEAGG